MKIIGFHLCKTRNKMIFEWSNRSFSNEKWRIKPYVAAKASDELFEGVKSESNLELAGCRRNSFK